MRPDCKAIGLTGKFSTRPAGYNTTRMRDNQRRHRARVKSYIADLEARLSESEGKLETALATISRLAAENEAHQRHTNSYGQSGPSDCTLNYQAVSTNQVIEGQDPINIYTTLSHVLSERTILEATGPAAAEEPSITIADVLGPIAVGDESLAQTRIVASAGISAPEGPHATGEPANDDSNSANMLLLRRLLSPSSEMTEMPDDRFNQLPPPAPGESTTKCMDAYKIIEQQNFHRLDLAAISTWLRPGFRRAITEGDGCRVETNLLFTLLDYISSTGVRLIV